MEVTQESQESIEAFVQEWECQKAKRKVILDCDTGIDDALAIAYLVAQKDIDVIGITTAFGNATAEQAYQNTVDLLSALKRPDIPVFRGAEAPYGQESFVVSDISIRIHGKNGIGEADLPPAKGVEQKFTSAEFLVESALRYGKELIIIATGALTNLQLAAERNLEALSKVGSIVTMGGALTVRGNSSLFTEGNMSRDPLGAALFYASGIPFTMVGLDVSLTTVITEKELSAWTHISTPISEALLTMCRYYYTNEGDSEKEMSGCLHDPLAAALAIKPQYILQSFQCDLMVETEGETIGRTIRNPKLLLEGPENHKVILKVDGPAFVQDFIDSIKTYLESIR